MIFPHPLWITNPISIYDDWLNPFDHRLFTEPNKYVYFVTTNSTDPSGKSFIVTNKTDGETEEDAKTKARDMVAEMLRDLERCQHECNDKHEHKCKCETKKTDSPIAARGNHDKKNERDSIPKCNRNLCQKHGLETLSQESVDDLKKVYVKNGWDQSIFKYARIPGTNVYNKSKILRDFSFRSQSNVKQNGNANVAEKNNAKINLDKKRMLEFRIAEKQRELSMYKDRIESLNRQVNKSISEIEKMKTDLLNFKI